MLLTEGERSRSCWRCVVMEKVSQARRESSDVETHLLSLLDGETSRLLQRDPRRKGHILVLVPLISIAVVDLLGSLEEVELASLDLGGESLGDVKGEGLRLLVGGCRARSQRSRSERTNDTHSARR